LEKYITGRRVSRRSQNRDNKKNNEGKYPKKYPNSAYLHNSLMDVTSYMLSPRSRNCPDRTIRVRRISYWIHGWNISRSRTGAGYDSGEKNTALNSSAS
jgi:hypothetical protein